MEWDRGLFIPSFKERPGRAGGKTRLSRDIHGHHLVTIAVKQLTPVRIPHRLGSSFGRDLPLTTRTWIRLHINLKTTRFVRDIRKPAPVRRKTWLVLIGPCSVERKRLAVFHSQNPDVLSRRGIDFLEDQQLPVG